MHEKPPGQLALPVQTPAGQPPSGSLTPDVHSAPPSTATQLRPEQQRRLALQTCPLTAQPVPPLVELPDPEPLVARPPLPAPALVPPAAVVPALLPEPPAPELPPPAGAAQAVQSEHRRASIRMRRV